MIANWKGLGAVHETGAAWTKPTTLEKILHGRDEPTEPPVVEP